MQVPQPLSGSERKGGREKRGEERKRRVKVVGRKDISKKRNKRILWG